MENQHVNEDIEVKEDSAKVDGQEAQANSGAEGKPEEIDWKAKYYYLAADFENARRRFQKEKEDIAKYGVEKVMRDLMDVVDNLDRTIDMLKGDQDPKVKNIVYGVDMVRKMFTDCLSKNGLTEVETTGKEFDPNFHEAMSQVEAEGKKTNDIVQVFQKGYLLNGRLARAAKVVVAK
jgi:molecular chaperone GrpE